MKIRIGFAVLVLCTLLLFTSCSPTNISPDTKTEKKTESKDRIYAVWLNYNELSMKDEADKSEGAFRNKADAVFRNCSELGINRVFAQVRPFSDAFYKSDIFPATSYLSGKQGEYIGYDALEILCEYAEKYAIKIDAWINPYRVSYDSDIEKLSENNPARLWAEQGRTDAVKITGSGIFYNPACTDTQKLVLDGIRELIWRYKIDGIHIDDYFYPTTDEAFDSDEYASYILGGGKLDLYDWRRENVNNLMMSIYSLVHSYDGNLLFSVSPCGDIYKNRNLYCADVEKWVSQEGYCDMIVPQLYYGFENESKPFSETLEAWCALRRSASVSVLIGLAFYKYGQEDMYAGSGKDEWLTDKDIISRQISQILSIDNLCGFSLYSYSYIFFKNNDEFCKNELQNIKYML